MRLPPLRGVLAALGLGAALLATWAVAIEPRWLEVPIHRVGLATGAPALRIALVADLHLGRGASPDVAGTLRALAPDLVVLAGDVLDDRAHLPELARFLAATRGLRRVAVLGNWEHWAGLDLAALRALYEHQHGVRLLVNEAWTFEARGRRVEVVGLDDPTAGQPDLKAAKATGRADVSLLVVHSPAYFAPGAPLREARRFDMCLAGHTHAGQVTLFGRPLWLPPGSGGFSAGLYQTAHGPLYVTRGIGTSLVPVRLGARPELPLFTW
ncbi:MAG: metallophosphoesterase [Candidatus Sericytochromatia bacterium]|nr:metallophosphoesterase [Candidatus Sericytochromatia bacterium]